MKYNALQTNEYVAKIYYLSGDATVQTATYIEDPYTHDPDLVYINYNYSSQIKLQNPIGSALVIENCTSSEKVPVNTWIICPLMNNINSTNKMADAFYITSKHNIDDTTATWHYSKLASVELETKWVKGTTSYGQVTALRGTYPDNGRASDGYWYVLQP